MVYGYARVSTRGQADYGNSLEDQRAKLTEAGAKQIFVDAFTGTKIDRPEFTKCLDALKSGDTLVVTKLDRIARTAAKGSELVQELIKRGVKVHVLNMGLIDNTPTGKLMVNMLFAFAEFERDMIVQRTQEGKAVAKQRPDFKEGRPSLRIDLGKYHGLRDEARDGKITVKAACRELGISRTSWYNLEKRES